MNKYFQLSAYGGKIATKFQKNKDKKMPFLTKDKPKIFLFGIPRHKNLGDQAIAYAEKNFLRKVAPQFEVIEIAEEAILDLLPSVRAIVSKNDIIAFHGGGNLGDIWPGIEDLRQAVIAQFTDVPVIIFPQTAFFSKKSTYKEKSIEIYNSNAQLTLFAREKETYQIMSNLFDKSNIYMVPDIVLSLNIQQELKRNKVTFFLRSDRERNSIVGQSVQKIIKLLNNSKTKFRMSDTVTDDYYFPIIEQNRKKRLYKKWSEFSESKFIVTDRLHGMIFARITGTPAIVLDNNNHKVKNSYLAWLKEDPNIIFISEIISEEQIKKINSWIKNNVEYQPVKNIDKQFKPLEKMFKK